MLFKLTSAKYLLVAALSLTLVVAIACGGAEEEAAPAAKPAPAPAPKAAAPAEKKTVANTTPTESTQAVAQKPLLPDDEQILKPLRYGCCNTMPYREGGWGRMFMQWTAMQPMKFDKNNGLQPHLALSYELSSDAVSYTHLTLPTIYSV